MTSPGPARSAYSDLRLRTTSTIHSSSSSSDTTSFSGTTTSGSSSSTVPGIGALSGKALKAFGEATLRFADNVVIRRRLAVISSHFPHKDWTLVKNAAQMYDDLLDLSRPSVYDPKTRRRALGCLTRQIRIGEMRGLVHSLTKYPPAEARILMSEFMSVSGTLLPLHDVDGDLPVVALPSLTHDSRSVSLPDDRTEALSQSRPSSSAGGSYLSFDSASSAVSSVTVVLSPQSLTGRVVRLFGDTALRTAEKLVVRRRLAYISSRFPLYDADLHKTKNAEQMYDDLVELTRTDSYAPAITRKALDIIVTQVSLHQAGQLLQSLAKLPSSEAYYFVIEFLNATYLTGNLNNRRIADWLRDSWTHHSLSLLTFLCRVAQLDSSGETFRYLLQESLLGMILCTCVREDSPEVAEALQIVDDTFTVFTRLEVNEVLISGHIICDLWPSHIPFCLRRGLVAWPNINRQRGWRRAGVAFVWRRLSGIRWVLDIPTAWAVSEGLIDICADLLEFSSWGTYDDEITLEASTLLSRFVQSGGAALHVYDACQNAMAHAPPTLLEGFEYLLAK